MRRVDWNSVEERTGGGFDRPEPGGYIAKICAVSDNEAKEYLKIEWDFADGAYKDEHQQTKDRAGFWPCPLFKSYKDSALGFFKAFKTAVENSNPGYVFDETNPMTLCGKLMGVVLGEEEYIKKDGEIATRLYVHSVRSLDAIRTGDFKVPELKRVKTTSLGIGAANTQTKQTFAELDDDDGEIPF